MRALTNSRSHKRILVQSVMRSALLGFLFLSPVFRGRPTSSTASVDPGRWGRRGLFPHPCLVKLFLEALYETLFHSVELAGIPRLAPRASELLLSGLNLSVSTGPARGRRCVLPGSPPRQEPRSIFFEPLFRFVRWSCDPPDPAEAGRPKLAAVIGTVKGVFGASERRWSKIAGESGAAVEKISLSPGRGKRPLSLRRPASSRRNTPASSRRDTPASS